MTPERSLPWLEASPDGQMGNGVRATATRRNSSAPGTSSARLTPSSGWTRSPRPWSPERTPTRRPARSHSPRSSASGRHDRSGLPAPCSRCRSLLGRYRSQPSRCGRSAARMSKCGSSRWTPRDSPRARSRPGTSTYGRCSVPPSGTASLGRTPLTRSVCPVVVGAALAVTRQVQRVNGGAIDVRAPKYGSERVVYLANGLVDLLAQHVADFGTIGDEQWLFTGEGDQPPHQNTVGYWWRKTLRVAGLSDIKLHDLRHFYASGPIAAGCDVVTVQRSLGHAKATTTLNTYAHLWPTAEDRTRKAAQSIIDASLGD